MYNELLIHWFKKLDNRKGIYVNDVAAWDLLMEEFDELTNKQNK